MNEEQIKYVENQLRAGVGESEVKQALRAHGYEEEQVDQLCAAAQSRISGEAPTSTGAENRSHSLPSLIEVLSGSLRFTFSRFDLVGWHILVTVGSVLGMGLVFGLLGSLSMVLGPAALVVAMVAFFPAMLLFLMLDMGALQYASSQQEKVTFWQGWKFVWKHLWSWAWQSFLVSMVMLVAYMVVAIPVAIVGAAVLAGMDTGLLVLIFVMMPVVIMVCLIIASFISLIFFVGISLHRLVFIHEGVRGLSALVRSRQLVRGHWWGVFGRFLVVALVLLVISIVTQVAVILLTISSGSAFETFIGSFASMLVGVINMLFFMRTAALMYFSLASGAPVFDPSAKDPSRTAYLVMVWIGGVFAVVFFGGAMFAMSMSFMSMSRGLGGDMISPPVPNIPMPVPPSVPTSGAPSVPF